MKLKLFCISFVIVILVNDVFTSAEKSKKAYKKDFKMYVSRCTACHQMRNPKNYSRLKWEFHVGRMFAMVGDYKDKATKDRLVGLWNMPGMVKKINKWNKKAKKKGRTWPNP